MKNIFLGFVLSISAFSCASKDEKINFSNIESDFITTDINNYDCSSVNEKEILHILETGEPVTLQEVHDSYSTVGCSVKGRIMKNDEVMTFIFDYGGIIYFGDGLIFSCAEECCNENFEYCTWEKK